jgi:hypothetical protein
MEIDLFACVAVSDLTRAVDWFDALLGEVDAFTPNDVEHVWTPAEHRHLYVELLPAAPKCGSPSPRSSARARARLRHSPRIACAGAGPLPADR